MPQLQACHWAFDGELHRPPLESELRGLLSDMVDAIAMTPICEPTVIVHQAHWTAIQIIAESHIIASGYGTRAFVDVFSCRVFDHRAALRVIERQLGGEAWSYLNIQRATPEGVPA